MWYYICASRILLVLAYIIQEAKSGLKNNYSREEEIFADVIRNISRVNNVLQELIANYEQLQKLYKSQENFESDYSSDTEIDEIYKNKKGVENKRGRHVDKAKEQSKELDHFPATKMIWSEFDASNDDSIEQSQEETSINSKLNQTITDRISSEIKSIITNIADPVLDHNISGESQEIEKYQIKQKPKRIEIETQNKGAKVQNEIQFAAFSKRSTTRHKVSYKTTRKNKKRVKNNSENVKQNIVTKKIKRIVYAEEFSPKTIWNEIIQNRPIKLKAQEEVKYKMNERKDLNNQKQNLKIDEGKTSLVIVTKNEKTKQDVSQSTEEEAISKEMLKTNVLRQAYGDACLKVVVKKCYKACKLVSKAVCARYSCKSKFKQKFKESSRSGCIREFRITTNNNATERMRGHNNDATRGRFLEACHTSVLHELEHPKLKNQTQLLKTNPESKIDKDLNILRDRYERACRRASTAKCVSACNYASKQTCDTFVCAKGLKRAYKKYCKRLCRASYGSRGEKSSSESYSESDDSDSSDTSFSHI